MKKIRIKIQVNPLRVRDIDHLKAQIRYPATHTKDKKKYDRVSAKKEERKIIAES